MKVLVTGADGFVGGWMIRGLLAAGHQVVGAHREDGGPPAMLAAVERSAVEWRALQLAATDSVAAACSGRWDAVIHLAALASGSEARRDPGAAWQVNAAGTARLVHELAGMGPAAPGGPLLLLVSTGEVYGTGAGIPRHEIDPTLPVSPYAASKLGAELAAQEASRRTGLRVIIARPFPHTGPGQDSRFVVPAMAHRLLGARKQRADSIQVGCLDPVRDLLDVRDVVAAYLALLERGLPGQIYNVASGTGYALADILERLERLAGWRVTPVPDQSLVRAADIMHLVGDSSKLRAATGWTPRIPLDQTLQDLLDAQAN